jgi:rhodanese-related sulfurtransferase
MSILTSLFKGSSPGRNSISASELKASLSSANPPAVIDVRSETEYAGGHIPGARNIPLDTIAERASELGSIGTVVMVCKSGMRSQTACSSVKAQVPDALSLTGGTNAWIEAGYSVDQGAS